MKAHIGMAFEVIGAALIAYALYTVQSWAGLIAAGMFAVIIGVGLGAEK